MIPPAMVTEPQKPWAGWRQAMGDHECLGGRAGPAQARLGNRYAGRPRFGSGPRRWRCKLRRLDLGLNDRIRSDLTDHLIMRPNKLSRLL